MAELTATVKQLQDDLRTKDEPISELQKQQLTPKNSIITIEDSPNHQATSPNPSASSNNCF